MFDRESLPKNDIEGMRPNPGNLLIILGIGLILFGLLLNSNFNFPLPGNLPGDIKIKGDNYSFYFPLTTSILLSVLLSLLLYFFNR